MSTRRRHNPSARRGASLLELTVAIVLLGVVFAGLGPMFAWIRQERQLSHDRQAALLELANQAERMALRPYVDLTADSVAAVTLSPHTAAALPHAQLQVRLAPETDPEAKRLTFEITWSDDGVRPAAPLRMVQWRFPDAGGAP
jgi:Tfp pilus assembly protein PilV